MNVEVCNTSDEDSIDDDSNDNISDPIQIGSSAMHLLQFIVLFFLSWQAIFRVSYVAVDMLFKFIFILLSRLCNFCNSETLKEVAISFPNSLFKAQKFHSIIRNDYQKLIVCPTFEYEDCLSRLNASKAAQCSISKAPTDTHESTLWNFLTKIGKNIIKEKAYQRVNSKAWSN